MMVTNLFYTFILHTDGVARYWNVHRFEMRRIESVIDKKIRLLSIEIAICMATCRHWYSVHTIEYD